MIRQLHLVNFKPFREFTVTFSGLNVLIGPNNAGKSSIVQALRAGDLAARFFNRTGQREFDLPDNKFPFSLRNARNLYAEDSESTSITCEFADGDSISLEINEPGEGFHASVFSASRRTNNVIGFLPPVGPLEEDERLLQRDYVRSTMNTHLAPRHFRNQWHHFPENIDEFVRQLSVTWPGVTLGRNMPNPELVKETGYLYMFYEESRVGRELAWAGSGLQIWMQILTCLVNSRGVPILVLDEPELYLHSDVQRKIGVTAFNVPDSQILIATHSVDIVNEVEPEQIVTIDNNLTESKRLFDVGAVQDALTALGSTQNIKLSRLARTTKCLFMEGEDFKILRRIAANLGYGNWEEGREFSVFSLEGFEKWPLLEGVEWVFENILGENIQAYVILDRDYRTETVVEHVRNRLQQAGVRCHVWERKELENYLLVPELITDRLLRDIDSRRGSIPRTEMLSFVVKALDEIAEDLRDETHSKLLAEYQEGQRQSGKDRSTVNLEFNRTFTESWRCVDWRLSRIPGKRGLARLNQRLQNQYQVSLSTARLASSFAAKHSPPELNAVLRELSGFARPATTPAQSRLL